VTLWRRFRLLFISTLVMVFVIIVFILFAMIIVVSNSSTVTSLSLLVIFFCLNWYCYPQSPCFSYEYLCKFVNDFINTFFCLFGHVHFPPMNFLKFIILVVLLTFHVLIIVFYSIFLHYSLIQQHSSFPSTIVTLHYTP